MDGLNYLDRKILVELDKDSRQTYSKLAKKTRSKKDTVKYRVEKLIEKDIIQSFYTVINYSKLGFISFRFYIQLSDISLEKKQEMISYLVSHKNIWLLYQTTGQYHFSFNLWVRDQWECEQFWDDFTSNFGIYLYNYHLSLKIKYTEFSRGYLIDKKTEKEQFTILQKTNKEQLDGLDFNILNILSMNARTSLVDISKKTSVSVVTCRSRLRHLIKKKIIVGFRIMLNYEKLGYLYYKVDLWFSNTKKRKEIMQRVLSHPNVIYTEKTLISSDFEFDLEVKGFNEFIAIMDSFEKQFPNDTKRYEYYTLIKNYKVNYLPSL